MTKGGFSERRLVWIQLPLAALTQLAERAACSQAVAGHLGHGECSRLTCALGWESWLG